MSLVKIDLTWLVDISSHMCVCVCLIVWEKKKENNKNNETLINDKIILTNVLRKLPKKKKTNVLRTLVKNKNEECAIFWQMKSVQIDNDKVREQVLLVHILGFLFKKNACMNR
jgi:hypothetical protein